MDPKLQKIIDEAEIRDIHIRYCRGIDRMDWDLIRSCYHPDATDCHGDYEGGVDGFIAQAKEVLPTFESTQHFTGNQLVQVDGDTAVAEHYAFALHRMKGRDGAADSDWCAFARYVDRMERRNGEWRIARRVVVIDSERVDPVSSNSPPLANFTAGRRDREDVSYRFGL